MDNTITYATHNTITLEDFINKEHPTSHEQAQYMADSARTNILMFKATGDVKYENQAKKDIQKGKDILNGFMRPLGAIA